MTDLRCGAVVTGIGALTALGEDLASSWNRLIAGESGIDPVEAFNCADGLAGEIKTFNPLDHFNRRTAARLDRCSQFVIVAARQACADVGRLDADPDRVAIIIGSSLGGTISGQRFERERLRSGRLRRLWVYEHPLHRLLEHLTEEFGFRGPRMVFSTACTASTIAIAYATELLRSGRVDAVLAGGVDPLAELSYVGFSTMGNVSLTPCAPFSEPVGLTVGEGAAMLMLEREDRAEAAGRRPRARLLGYGLSADAYHPTSGDPSGRPQAQAARAALAMSGVDPSAVDYVNAHGTGTATNDPVETRLLHLLLGPRAKATPVSSLKGAFGHTLGAAGAVETAMTVVAIEQERVPPTANFTRARAGCDLDYVPNRSRPHRIRNALAMNFAFGGNNCALVLAHPEERSSLPTPPVRRRVVVTGLGIVSPIGIGVEGLRIALEIDRNGVTALRRLQSDGKRLGAAIEDFAPATITFADLRRADRVASFTVCAADLALRDAALQVSAANQERIGLIVGTGHGPTESCRRFYEPVASGRQGRANPSIFPNTVVNAGAGLAAMHLRLKGPNAALSSGQASGLAALCCASDLVGGGAADAIVAGGAEELVQSLLDGYQAARRIAPYELLPGAAELCAPFDRRRSGLVLGEGATFLVVEALDNAVARGARIYAELAGWAGNADQPKFRGWDRSGAGMAACMTAALADARADSKDCTLVAAAALSHPIQDAVEAAAIRQVFGPHRVPVFSMVSRVGASAATSSLAAAAVALGMRDGFSPTGVARGEPDPDCDIDLLEGALQRASNPLSLVNAAALGGTNYSLVVRAW